MSTKKNEFTMSMIRLTPEQVLRPVSTKEILARLSDVVGDLLTEVAMVDSHGKTRLEVAEEIWNTLDFYRAKIDMGELGDADASPSKWTEAKENSPLDTLAKATMEALALVGGSTAKWAVEKYRMEKEVLVAVRDVMAEALVIFFFGPLDKGVPPAVVLEAIRDKFDFRTPGTRTWMETRGLPVGERYKYIPGLSEEEREECRQVQEKLNEGMDPKEALGGVGVDMKEMSPGVFAGMVKKEKTSVH